MLLLKRIFGVLYILAGLGKAFPRLEDVNDILHQAVLANQGTVLFGISRWLSGHSSLVIVFVGLVLFFSGVCFLMDRLLVFTAVGQILMLLCFIIILHRLYPQILFIDVPFLIVALLVIREQFGKSKAGM